MSKAGRKLQVGDEAITDFRPGLTLVRITARFDGTKSHSGTQFRVSPTLVMNDPDAKFDADWFDPAPKDLL